MSQRTLQGFFVKRSAPATSEYASAEETETVELPESDEDQIFTDKTEDEPPSKQVINFLLDMYVPTSQTLGTYLVQILLIDKTWLQNGVENSNALDILR